VLNLRGHKSRKTNLEPASLHAKSAPRSGVSRIFLKNVSQNVAGLCWLLGFGITSFLIGCLAIIFPPFDVLMNEVGFKERPCDNYRRNIISNLELNNTNKPPLILKFDCQLNILTAIQTAC